MYAYVIAKQLLLEYPYVFWSKLGTIVVKNITWKRKPQKILTVLPKFHAQALDQTWVVWVGSFWIVVSAQVNI